ncbi:MAG: LL-diaminopimelate aminotransferase [Candidatus Melainabacteria bacterium]|nr:LL-diaminopimelate aminotransferase [Candidatus Melainabacteria bacterium]
MRFAKRIKSLPPYLFAEIDKKRQAAIARGVDIINMGIGDPDQPTFKHIVDAMHSAIDDPSTHNYPPYQGMKEFKEAAVKWFENRFGQKFNADTECVSLIGSKEAIHNCIFATIDEGDIALLPDPAYPVYKSSTVLCGGKPYIIPLLEKNNWLPDLTKIPNDIAQKANIIMIDYPNNPTSAIAPLEFYNELISFAKKYDIIVLSDNAYSELTFNGYKAPSVFEAKGARDIALEFHSLSKTYNMTGWRIGFAVGNEKIIKALGTVKTNIDSGIFKAIQRAGVAAFNTPKEIIEKNNSLYKERSNVAIKDLKELGWNIREPLKATFYLWLPIPPSFKTSSDFATAMLDKCGIVVPPGSGYGEYGEGYFRIALTIDKKRIEEAILRMKKEGLAYEQRSFNRQASRI